ncbi:MAG: anaerobic ribonucleoside-triphosphate reductase activating protein [Burkholderiaceae bacterium]|nr:anaerobic ribonucleoside-triphosphate reductase activating protein [Burkholderiaceae bacterium]
MTAQGGLRVGGLTPLTTIDFPGRLAAVVFCQGCAWRCGYCQNSTLLEAGTPAALRWDDVLAFLGNRQGLLDGVVFSGGEPTLQTHLPAAIEQVRALGFEVGLHTAGMYPARLARLLPRLDWVGLDIKAPLRTYDAVTGTTGGGAKARESLDLLLAAGVPFECRTTWHPGLFPMSALEELADELAARGVTHWTVQCCRIDGRPAVAAQPPELRRLAVRFKEFHWRA